jgi:hypothetical protein
MRPKVTLGVFGPVVAPQRSKRGCQNPLEYRPPSLGRGSTVVCP